MVKMISQSHWNSIMNKLVIDDDMSVDEAYNWMCKRFSVSNSEFKKGWN